MKFWIDAQLPPGLALWLSEERDVEAFSLRDLGLRDATDEEIFESARRAAHRRNRLARKSALAGRRMPCRYAAQQ
jgi:hypothetical protein